ADRFHVGRDGLELAPDHLRPHVDAEGGLRRGARGARPGARLPARRQPRHQRGLVAELVGVLQHEVERERGARSRLGAAGDLGLRDARPRRLAPLPRVRLEQRHLPRQPHGEQLHERVVLLA
ncbi:hypothetical protein RZS08_01220, partial [Arthrospira platensis SPKY1]|nr:hypothetical protein [Arthrospira platensis SPKY1]